MTLSDLYNKIGEFFYTEDTGMIKVSLASIISTRLKLGNPIWCILIGPSSSGKSQILRPLALTDTKFIHRVDDLTENTLLSGAKVKKGEPDISLLNRIGSHGIMVISDLTVIFSKGSEQKNSILAQFRMMYDGEMSKSSGVSNKTNTWKGSLGMLAGSTPAIYRHFEEVADMGERFIYYRMKDYDVEKATRLAIRRKIYGRELDDRLSEVYDEYIKDVVKNCPEEVPPISEEIEERIIKIAMFAAKLRTPTCYDKYDKAITRIPVTEMPARVAMQLAPMAKAFSIMRHHDTGSWDLLEEDILHIEYCAYSLANEEIRACLKVIGSLDYGDIITTQTVADTIGLSTTMTGVHMQHLAAVKLISRSGSGGGLSWKIKDLNTWEIINRLDTLVEVSDERDLTDEEEEQQNEESQQLFDREF